MILPIITKSKCFLNNYDWLFYKIRFSPSDKFTGEELHYAKSKKVFNYVPNQIARKQAGN